MAITRLETIMQLKQCPDDVTLKILEATESGIDQWSDEIIQHLIDCQSCRLLLEDYIEVNSEPLSCESEESSIMDNLFVIFSPDGLVSSNQATSTKKPLFRGAAPKLDKTSQSNSFSIITRSGMIKAEMFWIDEKVKITLSNVKPEDRYYIVKSGDKNRLYSNYCNGILIFDNIQPGNYAIKEDKPDNKGSFKFIRIISK